MESYSFAFTIQGFDQWGEEHRLRVHPTTVFTEPEGSGLIKAVKSLVEFAAKLLHCQPDHLAAQRIVVKSAWKDAGKRTRVTPKQITEALLKAGFSQKGREAERIKTTPRSTPLGRRLRRR